MWAAMFVASTEEMSVKKRRLGSYTDYDTRMTGFCGTTARSEVIDGRACQRYEVELP